jgi:hypothetical protein
MNDEPGLDKSVRNTEMRTCTINEVKDYFNKRMRRLEDEVSNAKRGLSNALTSLSDYKKMTKAFLSEKK